MKIKKGDWFKSKITHLGLKEGNLYIIINDRGQFFDDDGDYRDMSSINIHFTKLYTIQDLKNGKVAVENNGTVDELNEVLLTSFPADIKAHGMHGYYYEKDGEWRASDDVGLPTQSVKDFLAQLPKKGGLSVEGEHLTLYISEYPPVAKKEEEWTPKVGEKVEFKHSIPSFGWQVAEYLATSKESRYPYALVYTAPAGSRFITTSPEIRQIPKKVKVTKQRVADILGIELNQLEII